jgi:SSS family solute:Na+ symporter
MNVVFLSILIYVGLLLGASLWHRRQGLKGAEDFLIADRNLNVKMAGLSIFASFIGGGTIMGNTNLIFTYGAPMLFFVFALPLGLLLLRQFSGVIHEKSRKEGWLTYYDMFNSRFGSETKTLVALIQILSLILIASVSVIGGAKMIQLLIHISYTQAVLLMAIVVAGYLMISGFASVVKTDVIQAIFLLVLFAGFFVFSLVSPSDVRTYSDYNFDSIGTLEVVLFAVIAFFYVFGDEGIFQRIYAAKDVKTVKKSLLFGFFVYFIFYVVLVGSVFKLKALYPELSGDMAFLEGLVKLVPVGFHWLVSVAVLSVVLSTIDTYVFAAIMNINKFLAEYKIKLVANHGTLVRNMKITTPLVFVLVVFIALYVQSVLDTVYFYAALNGCNALIVIIALTLPKLNKLYALLPISINLVLCCLLVIFKGFSPTMVVIPFLSIIVGVATAFGYNKFFVKKAIVEKAKAE